MNDFTKEELEYIQDMLCAYLTLPVDGLKVNESVLIKLESMIDNYCEHEPERISFSSCPLGTDMSYKCKKCGKIIR